MYNIIIFNFLRQRDFILLFLFLFFSNSVGNKYF